MDLNIHYQILSSITTNEVTQLLRELLKKHIYEEQLPDYYKTIVKPRTLFGRIEEQLVLSSPTDGYDKFDLSLLIKILRFLCGTEINRYLECLYKIRNAISHLPSTNISQQDFERWFGELCQLAEGIEEKLEKPKRLRHEFCLFRENVIANESIEKRIGLAKYAVETLASRAEEISNHDLSMHLFHFETYIQNIEIKIKWSYDELQQLKKYAHQVGKTMKPTDGTYANMRSLGSLCTFDDRTKLTNTPAHRVQQFDLNETINTNYVLLRQKSEETKQTSEPISSQPNKLNKLKDHADTGRRCIPGENREKYLHYQTSNLGIEKDDPIHCCEKCPTRSENPVTDVSTKRTKGLHKPVQDSLHNSKLTPDLSRSTLNSQNISKEDKRTGSVVVPGSDNNNECQLVTRASSVSSTNSHKPLHSALCEVDNLKISQSAEAQTTHLSISRIDTTDVEANTVLDVKFSKQSHEDRLNKKVTADINKKVLPPRLKNKQTKQNLQTDNTETKETTVSIKTEIDNNDKIESVFGTKESVHCVSREKKDAGTQKYRLLVDEPGSKFSLEDGKKLTKLNADESKETIKTQINKKKSPASGDTNVNNEQLKKSCMSQNDGIQRCRRKLPVENKTTVRKKHSWAKQKTDEYSRTSSERQLDYFETMTNEARLDMNGNIPDPNDNFQQKTSLWPMKSQVYSQMRLLNLNRVTEGIGRTFPWFQYSLPHSRIEVAEQDKHLKRKAKNCYEALGVDYRFDDDELLVYDDQEYYNLRTTDYSGDVVILHSDAEFPQDRDLADKMLQELKNDVVGLTGDLQEAVQLPGTRTLDVRPFFNYRKILLLITGCYIKSPLLRYKIEIILRLCLKYNLTHRLIPVQMESAFYPCEVLPLVPLEFYKTFEDIDVEHHYINKLEKLFPHHQIRRSISCV